MTTTDVPLALQPLHLAAPDPARSVTFPNRAFLAPMEGVTDRVFRDVVLDLGGAGGASTEFVRVSVGVLPARVFRRELGPPRADVPVAIQIMAAGTEHLAETVANADRARPAYIDLNFGCPVKRVCGKGAGAALLDSPPLVGRIVAEAVGATTLAVTAKIRAGVTDDARLEDVLHACAEAGARLVTLHARRRVDPYSAPARWEWIARAADVLRRDHPGVLLVGNGGVATVDDVHRMLAATRCDGVMIGRGALADPFVFRSLTGAPPPTRSEAAAFLLRYLEAMQPVAAARHGLGRVKQLIRVYTAGGLVTPDERDRLLRASTAGELSAFLRTALA